MSKIQSNYILSCSSITISMYPNDKFYNCVPITYFFRLSSANLSVITLVHSSSAENPTFSKIYMYHISFLTERVSVAGIRNSIDLHRLVWYSNWISKIPVNSITVGIAHMKRRLF